MGDRRAIDGFASRQYGVFNNRQAREAGFDKNAIWRRVQSGEWVQLDHSVYCVASASPRWERDMAAAILSRRQAVVAGASAAHLHRLRGFEQAGRPVMMIPTASNARSELARVIQAKRFAEIATTGVAGFAVTTLAETMVQIARDLSAFRMEAVFDDAVLAGKLDLAAFQPILDREGESRARGLGLVRSMVADRVPGAPSHDSTFLERRLEMILAGTQVPSWTREYGFSLRGRPSRVDVFIPEWALVIEADGRNWHARRSDFENDRLRDNTLATHGIQVLRFTYSMLMSDAKDCVSTILRVGALRNASGLA